MPYGYSHVTPQLKKCVKYAPGKSQFWNMQHAIFIFPYLLIFWDLQLLFAQIDIVTFLGLHFLHFFNSHEQLHFQICVSYICFQFTSKVTFSNYILFIFLIVLSLWNLADLGHSDTHTYIYIYIHIYIYIYMDHLRSISNRHTLW